MAAHCQQTDRLLYEAHAADLLKVSVRTLQAWRCKRVGPDFVRIGRAIRYRESDLTRWIEERLVRCGSEHGQ